MRNFGEVCLTFAYPSNVAAGEFLSAADVLVVVGVAATVVEGSVCVCRRGAVGRCQPEVLAAVSRVGAPELGRT